MEKATMSAFWQLLEELANLYNDGYMYNDHSGMMECHFCRDTHGFAANEKHTHTHEEDCLITRARALLAARKEDEG